jgi:predicted nucleic acid-binding protein
MYLSVIKRDSDLIDDRPRWQIARNLFRAAERGDVMILASNLVQVEVTGNGEVRSAKADSPSAELVRKWFLADWIEWCDVDRVITHQVATLSRNFHLRGADAVHLASAIRLHADYLISNDKGFRHAHGQTIEGVQVVTPQILWQETLEDGVVT